MVEPLTSMYKALCSFPSSPHTKIIIIKRRIYGLIPIYVKSKSDIQRWIYLHISHEKTGEMPQTIVNVL